MKSTVAYLVERLLHTHESEEVPSFRLPAKAHLLSIKKINGQEFQYELFNLEEQNALEKKSFFDPEDSKRIFDAASSQNSFQIAAASIKNNGHFSWDENCELRIMPFSLLSKAKALMLFPTHHPLIEDKFFHEYVQEFSLLTERSMFVYFQDRYTPDHLLHFNTIHELLFDFAQEVAEWLCPNYFSFKGEDYPYDNTHKTDIEFRFYDTMTEDSREAITYYMPSKSLYFSGMDQNSMFDTRKIALEYSLGSFFHYICAHWKFYKEREVSRFLNKGIAQLDQLIETLQEVKTKVNALQHVSNDSPLTPTPFYEHLPKTEISPFAFFESDTGQWQVFFEGKNCTRPCHSPLGMAAIHLLLKNPDQAFKPEELYLLLQKMGKTYKQDRDVKFSDPSLSQIQREEDEEAFEGYQDYWLERKSWPLDKLKPEDLNMLKYFKECIDLKISYELKRNRPKLFTLRKEVADKAEELELFFGNDDVMQDSSSSITKPANKNYLDTIRKGIRRALRDFQNVPEIINYFETTLILINKDGFKPFIFRPNSFPSDHGFSFDPLDLDWDTEG